MSTPDQTASAGPSAYHDSSTADIPPDVARVREERAKKEELAREQLALARDEEAAIARKRMNLELLEMLKRPAKPNAPTSAKGIGLFTHIEGATKPPRFPHERCTKGEPEFLPIGGPDSIARKGPRSSALDGDVERLWRVVQSTVLDEENFCRQSELSLGDLKERYVSLEVPGSSAQPHSESAAQQLQLQQQDAAMQDDIALQERRPSLGLTVTDREAAQRRAGEPDKLSSNEATAKNDGITATAAVNTYEAIRDPRLQRR